MFEVTVFVCICTFSKFVFLFEIAATLSLSPLPLPTGPCNLLEHSSSSYSQVPFHLAQMMSYSEARDLHGRPWGFFGPPVPVTEKNPTRTLGRGKLRARARGSVGFPCSRGYFGLRDFESRWHQDMDKKTNNNCISH